MITKRPLIVLPIFLLGLVTAACGQYSKTMNKPVQSVGSCIVPATNSCNDYINTTPSAASADCDTMAGTTFATTACSTADVIGNCQITENGVTSIMHFYNGFSTVQTARSICASANAYWLGPY